MVALEAIMGIPLSEIQRQCKDCGRFVRRGEKHKCEVKDDDA